MNRIYHTLHFIIIFFFFGFIHFSKAATVPVHDPSIVIVYKDASGNSFPTNNTTGTLTKYYYVFGTQNGAAYSKDMLNWTSFTPTYSVNGTVSANYYNVFKANADWSKHTTSANVLGNLWAPDIIYNKVMKKWCLYFSLNGDDWLSSICMLTSNKIEGPYALAGTVVYSGMDKLSSGVGNMDYQKVTGSATVANRYLNTSTGAWKGEYGSSCIDPNVLYDESGKLWMLYGSWSGGLFLIKLDENTGLRNYAYNYGFTNFSADGASWNGTSLKYDPYMGIHVGGGYYVSGEGAYIEYFNGFYYMFVSMGFYSPEGGYTMRVFRSATIDGEYKDVTGDNAIFSRFILNYGNNVQYGMPIMQNFKYNWWAVAQVAQGHNSLLRDEDGKAYMIYHTKQDNGTAWHNVEVHQLFFNEKGWPLAAPFEYRKDFGLTTKTHTAEDIAGRYGVIAHKAVDYANLKSNTEKEMYINADGTLTGAYIGTWVYNYSSGKQFITLTTNAGTYQAVLGEYLMDGLSTKTLAFTGMNVANEQCLWGYRYTNTATATTTNYRGQSLLIGDKNYTLAFDAYDKFNANTVSGDFEVEYTFVNNTLAAENWHNWSVAFKTTTETWYMRADAFSNATFTGSTVGYWYNWDWATFKPVFQNKEVRVKVSRIGTTINVFAFVDNQLVYTASSINSPTGNLTIYLGGETCYLDVKKVSVSTLGARQKIGVANDDGTYTAGFNVEQGLSTATTGDFNLTYTFNNYHNSVSTNNWDNFILKAISGTNTMLVRADAFAMNTFGTLTYTYDWDWANFLNVISGANIVLNITRSATTITYAFLINAKDGKEYNYKIVQTQAPTTAMSFGFTCEQSFVDLFKVEKSTFVGTDIIAGNSETDYSNSSNRIYVVDDQVYIEATEYGKALVYSLEGKFITDIQYTKGKTIYSGLKSGFYLVNGTKVIIK